MGAALVLGALVAAAPPAAPDAPKRLRAAPLGDARIALDGALDEPIWRTAEVGSDFVERRPYPGSTPPVRTEVRVLASPDGLYVGVVCFLAEGERPRALELQRDSFGVFSDEAIGLKLDVRHDTRTTVGFATNPAGVQFDYVAVEGGEAFRREFDAIWEVATRVHEDRWVAEFELPAVALGLPDDAADTAERVVGLNVTRDHNARLATYDWSPIPAEFGPTSALFYGDLLGTDPIGGGRPLSLIPYVLGDYDSGPDRFDGRVGGDVRLRVGEDVWTELTVLTDFAQVDLDDPVVNLDRFALFFPERRPFFLSGLEFFDFGAGGESQVYFSRRIGLDEDGDTIDLLAGAKGYGTVGSLRFGVLGALTDDGPTQPARTYSVARLRNNFGENGQVGAIATLRTDFAPLSDGDPEVSPRLSLGVDGGFRALDRRLEVTAFGATSLAPDGDAPEGATGELRVGWRGFHLQPSFSLLAVTEDFEPAVGFVRRSNRLEPVVELNWIQRTDVLGLQSFNVYARGFVTQALDDGAVLTQQARIQPSLQFRSGYEAVLGVGGIRETVVEPTEIAGYDVQPGTFAGPKVFVYLASPGGRNPFVNLSYFLNDAFFGGTAHTFAAGLDVRFGRHLYLTNGVDLAFLSIPGQGERTTVTNNARLSWTPSTTLQLDLIGQLNTFDEEGAILGRIRWRYLPGSDLFLVYREGLDASGERLRSRRTLTLKVGFRYDALL